MKNSSAMDGLINAARNRKPAATGARSQRRTASHAHRIDTMPAWPFLTTYCSGGHSRPSATAASQTARPGRRVSPWNHRANCPSSNASQTKFAVV